MQLSIIIVSYNVSQFLQQCLRSVEKAIQPFTQGIEVFVIDNASTDDSVSMVQTHFPWVHCIINPHNLGFSKANNVALRLAKGRYVLLLNPDTLIGETSLLQCVNFMEQSQNKVGGLGVRIVDGTGRFLPESKRAFPTPFVAFCKAFGITNILPTSPVFGRYYLGHLDEKHSNEIEVLPGAFMFLQKAALDKVGLLDEDFFMYGEDIDLSHRLILGGYKNYYLADVTILHYKGESTNKNAFKYVLIFYKAMAIFAKKHFKGAYYAIFLLFIYIAIVVRGGIAAIGQMLRHLWLVLLDGFLFLTSLIITKNLWAVLYHQNIDYYNTVNIKYHLCIYTFIWLFAMYINGSYLYPKQTNRFLSGSLIGILLLIIIYALLPESMRFSRAILLLSSFLASCSSILLRFFIFHAHFFKEKYKNIRTIIVGKVEECSQLYKFDTVTQIEKNYVGIINPDDIEIKNVQNIIETQNVKNLIFCTKSVKFDDIIECMNTFGNNVQYECMADDGTFLISSHSKNKPSHIYTLKQQYILSDAYTRYNKRIFDVVLSCLCILFCGLFLLFFKKGRHFLKILVKILIGKMTWVGYTEPSKKELPPLLPAVTHLSVGLLDDIHLNKAIIDDLNVDYAKNYSIMKDIKVLVRFFKIL